VANADLDALPGNLDAAAAGHLPLDRQPRGRERIWPGQADAPGSFAAGRAEWGRQRCATRCRPG
jgi:hypothetical protein